jgi:hypothetical protein
VRRRKRRKRRGRNIPKKTGGTSSDYKKHSNKSTP